MMSLAFVETAEFTEWVQECFGNDVAYLDLQKSLIRNPMAGAVMPRCGGLRKLRWPDPRRGKGKRGGLRIIYLYVPMGSTILLMDAYDKDEADDLSLDVKKALRAEADEFRQNVAQRKNG